MGNKWAMVETIAHFIYAHAEAVENVASATLQRRENVLCTFFILELHNDFKNFLAII